MTSDRARRELSKWQPRPPNANLDRRIRLALIGIPETPARAKFSRNIARFAGGFLLAALLAIFTLVLRTRSLEHAAPSIAWAQVERSLHASDAGARTVHFIEKTYAADPTVVHGEVVTTGEVWVKRPNFYRTEERTYIADRLLKSTYLPPHDVTYIYNDAGEWMIDHTTKRYGRRTADTLVQGRFPARTADYAAHRAAQLTGDRLQFPGWLKKTRGVFAGTEQSDGGTIIKYRFENANGGWSLFSLKQSDGVPVKVSIGLNGSTDAQIEYESIEFGAEIPNSKFLFAPPAGYTDGQQIGLEDRPVQIHPEIVVADVTQSSARFWRKNPHDANASPDKRPSIEVFFDPVLIGVIKLSGSEYSTESERTLSMMNGRDPLGSRYYLVERASQGVTSVALHLEHDTLGSGDLPIVTIVTYCTDRIRAKIAYDADHDGEYDVWACIEEPTLPAMPETAARNRN